MAMISINVRPTPLSSVRVTVHEDGAAYLVIETDRDTLTLYGVSANDMIELGQDIAGSADAARQRRLHEQDPAYSEANGHAKPILGRKPVVK